MLVEVVNFEDIKNNQLREINYKTSKILIARIDDKYYAVSGKCTHLGCDLSKGDYAEGKITCPCHGSEFNIIDGQVIKWIEDWPSFVGKITRKIGLAKGLATYEVVLQDNKLFVKID